MAGPNPKHPIRLNDKQYQSLKSLSRCHMKPWLEVQRARILVMAHEHPSWSNYDISAKVGSGIDMVRKCREQWCKKKTTESEPRSGAPRKFTALQRAQVTALACTRPEDLGKTWKLWSGSNLAETVVERRIADSISGRTIQRWLQQDKIKPWTYQTWQKPSDPNFIEKASPVLDLYENAAELKTQGEIVACIDEKTSIQAREPLHEPRPAISGHPVQVSDRYTRKGSLQLFCALMVESGVTLPRCFNRKRFVDFQKFLIEFFENLFIQGVKALHLILDNGPTHAPKQLQKWIVSLQLPFEVKIYWLPIHASWLDQTEIIFSKLQRALLTPCNFKDTIHLESEIMKYFDHCNSNPKPIQWTYTKLKLLKKFSDKFQEQKLAA